MNDQPVTIPTCRLCASQGRTTPVFATASGWVICPVCDRNIPHRPTPVQIAKRAMFGPHIETRTAICGFEAAARAGLDVHAFLDALWQASERQRTPARVRRAARLAALATTRPTCAKEKP